MPIVLHKIIGIHNAHVRKIGLSLIGQPRIDCQSLPSILLDLPPKKERTRLFRPGIEGHDRAR